MSFDHGLRPLWQARSHLWGWCILPVPGGRSRHRFVGLVCFFIGLGGLVCEIRSRTPPCVSRRQRKFWRNWTPTCRSTCRWSGSAAWLHYLPSSKRKCDEFCPGTTNELSKLFMLLPCPLALSGTGTTFE